MAFLGLGWLPVANTSRVENGKTIPQNWKRAWGYSKPNDVVMSHSWYWRSRTGKEKRHTSFSFDGTRNCLINSLRSTIWVDSNRRAKRVLTTVFKSRVGLFLKTHRN